MTEFVHNLKDELESTFKEEISVYFDVNPHDGLLETYDVDASLREKLKCLIFIPIISRTYCDPKSFAWEHEFKTFVEMASKDQIGLKVKLSNGNVASRVLPVQIHDLKSDDKCQIENELGNLLRSIEFIYAEPGVNRPLTLKDSDEKNLNKTNYRNQINKVANAIDEIISPLSLSKVINEPVQEIISEVNSVAVSKIRNHPVSGSPSREIKYKLIAGAVMLILIVSVFLIINVRKRNEAAGITTVAILPFQNMSGNEEYNSWQNGIQDALIGKISETDELKILPADIIHHDMKKHADLSITGTITGSGSTMRINARIIDNRTGSILQPYAQDVAAGQGFFDPIDPLTQKIKTYLVIRSLKEKVYIDPERMGYSDDAEAYRYFTYGQKEFGNRNYPEAIKLLSEAMKRDSNLIYATLHIGWAYHNMKQFDSAKILCQKVWKRKNTLPLNQQKYLEYVHSVFFGGTPAEWLEKQKQLLEMDENWPHLHYDIGNSYFYMSRYEEASLEYEKSLDLYEKKGVKPWWSPNYSQLGVCYYKTGQYKKAYDILQKGLSDFPEDYITVRNLAIVSFIRGSGKEAEEYLTKFVDLCKLRLIPKEIMTVWLGDIYSEADIPDKAEEFYLKAMKMDPQALFCQFSYACFLVDKTDRVPEGLNYFERTLENNPYDQNYHDYEYMDGKGWALFKLKRYNEACEILQKSWDLRLQKAEYDNKAFLHLQAAKDSLASSL